MSGRFVNTDEQSCNIARMAMYTKSNIPPTNAEAVPMNAW
jgi:hypothetical protein